MEPQNNPESRTYFISPGRHFGPDLVIDEIPARLFCWRHVTNFIDDPHDHALHCVTQAKGLASLKHQVEYSIDLLNIELEQQGISVILKVVEDDIMPDHRHKLLLDGEEIACFDDDFGYDCFDVSATTFKDKMKEVVMLALSKTAVDDLLDEVFGE